MMSYTHSIVSGLVLVSLTLVGLAGCDLSFNRDPATSVTVVVSGIESEESRQAVKSTLEDMTDGSGHMMSTSIRGSTMTTTVSPVSDVDSFLKKIDFGTVTNVDGRNIDVTYKP